MPNETTVLNENKREQGIELFITDSENEGHQIKISLTQFLRLFGTAKERNLVRTSVHSALRMTPKFPTLIELKEEGKEVSRYSIDDAGPNGIASNGGDGYEIHWDGRRFELREYNGAGDHQPGETEISELPTEDTR